MTRRRVPEALAFLQVLPIWSNFGWERFVYTSEEGEELSPKAALQALQDGELVFYRVERIEKE